MSKSRRQSSDQTQTESDELQEIQPAPTNAKKNKLLLFFNRKKKTKVGALWFHFQFSFYWNRLSHFWISYLTYSNFFRWEGKGRLWFIPLADERRVCRFKNACHT